MIRMASVLMLFLGSGVCLCAPLTLIPFLVPADGSSAQPLDINNNGQMSGFYYTEVNTRSRGLIESQDGSILETLDFPGIQDPPYNGATTASAINDFGIVAGSYIKAGDSSGISSHGFFYEGGTYTSFDFPISQILATFPTGVNNAGQIVGWYSDGSVFDHGFIRQADGTFESIAYPGAMSTYLGGINNYGDIAGSFQDNHGRRHGFVLSSGVFSEFQAPWGALTIEVNGINSNGQTFGWFEYKGKMHAFVRDANGDYTTGLGNIIGLNDYGMAVGAFAPNPIPEPQTFILFGTGCFAAWVFRRRAALRVK